MWGFSAAVLLTLGVMVAVSGYTIHGYDHQVPFSYSIMTKQEKLPSFQTNSEHLVHHNNMGNFPKGHYDAKDHTKYKFSYGVVDPKTGDIKTHWESRDADLIKGGYSLKEADGTTRLVHYTADHKNGFRTIVQNIKEQKNAKSHDLDQHKVHDKQNDHIFIINAGL